MSEQGDSMTPLSSLFFRSALRLQEDVDAAFGDLIERRWRREARAPANWPAVDLYEVDGSFLLLADLPGVAPEDIELRVEGREVCLCGLRWSTGFVRHERGVVVERTCGRFCRTFRLDRPVDAERIEQGCANGVYWARLPKEQEKGPNTPER